MIMPVPGWRDDNIAAGQRHLLAFNGGEPDAVNDEPTGKCNVPVCRSRLTRIDKLKTSIDGVSRIRRLCFAVNSGPSRLRKGVLRMLGLTSIRTLRSAFSSGTRRPAFCR